MKVEEEKAKRDARYAQRRAEHRCASCGTQGANTLAGHAYCASCAEKQRAREARHAEKQRQIELEDVFKAHGYTVSLPVMEEDGDPADLSPDKMAVLQKYGYSYDLQTDKWTVVA